MFGTMLTARSTSPSSSIALLLIPQDDLAKSSAPFVDVLNRLIGGVGRRGLHLFIVISGLGCAQWLDAAGGRVDAHARGVMGCCRRPGRTVNRYGAPVIALLLTGALATVVMLMNYSKSLVDGFTFLSIVVTAANLPLYFCCGLALVVLWRRGSGTPDPYGVVARRDRRRLLRVHDRRRWQGGVRLGAGARRGRLAVLRVAPVAESGRRRSALRELV